MGRNFQLSDGNRWLCCACVAILAYLALLPARAEAQENYATWTDSQRIYINTTPGGANIAGTMTNFPVLIRLNPLNFTRFSRTQPGGTDIRFASSTGAHLNYQIERWAAGANRADTAEIWVKVPSIAGNSSTQFIWMYFGKTGVADSSKGFRVFDTTNGYIGVWHLGEDPAGGTGALKDATVNALHATSKGGMGSGNLVNGVVGRAHNFDGVDDADSIPYAAALNTANAVTVSAWVNVRKFQNYSRIVSRGMPLDSNPWTIYSLNTHDTFPRWRGEVSSGDTGSQRFVLGRTDVSLNAWYYVAMTYDRTNFLMYRNGVQDSVPTPATITMNTAQTTPLMIGKSNYGGNPFNGVIDEAVVSRVARSPEWIKLSYETQKPTATCVMPQTATITITTQPAGESVLVGGEKTFSVIASVSYNVGTGSPLRYAWYKNSVTPANAIAGATAATYSLASVQIADTGNYYVVVSNEYGSVTSTAARLTVSGNAPTITTHPVAVSVGQTLPATFSVVASGVGTLTYQWYKVVNGVNTEIAVPATGLTAGSMTITAVQFSDSGLYRCVVTNDYGSVTSNTAKLTVLSGAPTITTHPSDTTVLASTQARFRVVASGTGLTYQWYKGTVGAGNAVTGATTATLTIASAQVADAGDYLCVVTNTYGSVTSNPGRLTVNDGRPVITVQPVATVAVLENRPFSLSITATSSVAMTYAWYRGTMEPSGIVGTSNPFNISAAQLDDAGMYACVVTNVFGSCTSTVSTVTVSPNKEVSNPIMIAGTLVDSTHVRLSVLRYSSLLTSTPDQVFTWDPDTVMIWYATNNYPTVVNPTSVRYKISKARLAAQGGNQFDTLVAVPRIGCNSYYFKGSVKWRSTAVPAARDSIPPFGNNASGATVYMCDTVRLVNPLQLAFQYTPPADSVVVVMTGLATPGIRWDLITQLALQYSVAGGSFTEVPILPGSIPAGNVFAITVKNPRFAGDSAGVNWNLFFKGVYNNKSDTVKATSFVGAKRPANTLTLSAPEVLATQVTLSWTNSGAAYDSLRIWYATSQIPDSLMMEPAYSQVTIDGTQMSTLIRNLKDQTGYFFGIQGQRQRVWSYIPAPAKTSATTEKDTSEAIPNTLRLLGVAYDTATAKMRITFRIADLGFQHRYGFTWVQRDSLPVAAPGEFVVEPSSSPKVGEIQYTDKLGQTLTHEFDLATASPSIDYGKPYYFAGWVSRVDKTWAPPTDTSILFYTIPQPKVVPVRLFPTNQDIVTAFGAKVVLRKVDAIDQVPVTLRWIENLPLGSSGLVPVNDIAFSIETMSTTPVRLLVGMWYNAGLIPPGATAEDIRMYHYDTVRSVWLVDTASIIPDSTVPVLYVQKYLPDCRYPFVLAVDIVPPSITLSGDTSSALAIGDSITMTAQVNDNIANTRLSLHAGRADERMTFNDTVKTPELIAGVPQELLVSKDYIQGDCGIRVLVRANDGRFAAAVDASRAVRFSNADGINPEYEQWVPLSATGVLDAPAVNQALDEYDGGTGTWKYDIHKWRLFRFLKGGWLEFSEAKADTFRFNPGRVLWLKTREDKAIDFGDGRSVSLKTPYTITLPGKAWTDFTLPYRFNIRIGDVLAANNADVMASLQFYQWQKPTSKGRYVAKEFYLPQNGLGKAMDTLFYLRSNNDKAAYTVWNNLATDVTLSLPGVPVVYSAVTGVAKNVAPGGDGWSVAVRSSDGDGELSPVFCAYVAGSGGTVTYPPPPTWSKVKVGIYDRTRSEVFGNVIARRIENGGYTYELVFENGLPIRTQVNYTVERLAGDAGIEIAVVDPSNGAIASGESTLHVDIGPNSREYRLLAIGSGGYIDGYGWKVERGAFSLGRVGPNPFKGKVTIEFTVPYGGIERVRCEFLDHRGRVVWSMQPEGRIHPGKNSITWTPGRKRHLAAGAYFVRLTGYDGAGRKTREQLAKIMLVR